MGGGKDGAGRDWEGEGDRQGLGVRERGGTERRLEGSERGGGRGDRGR